MADIYFDHDTLERMRREYYLWIADMVRDHPESEENICHAERVAINGYLAEAGRPLLFVIYSPQELVEDLLDAIDQGDA